MEALELIEHFLLLFMKHIYNKVILICYHQQQMLRNVIYIDHFVTMVLGVVPIPLQHLPPTANERWK